MMIKKMALGLLLILLTCTITATAFFGVGVAWLWRENILTGDGEAIQGKVDELAFRSSLLAELERELDCDLQKFFTDEDAYDASIRDEYLTKKLAKHLLTLVLEEDMNAALSFAEKFSVDFKVYHYKGAPLGGNLAASRQDDARKCMVTYEEHSYPVYVRFESELLKTMLITDYRIELFWMQNRIQVVFGCVISCILSLALWIIAGRLARRRGEEETTPFDAIPLEIVLAATGTGAWFLIKKLDEVYRQEWKDLWHLAGYLVLFVLLTLCTVCFLRWRFQRKAWYRFTLCREICVLLKRCILGWVEIFRGLSMAWKWLGMELLITLLEFALIYHFLTFDEDVIRFLCAWGILKLLLTPWIIRHGVYVEKLHVAIGQLVEGKMDAHVDPSHFPGALKKMAENVNAMAGSVSVAVEERLRSEKLKTELITNVSHDIKTPLTSVINFADLIEKEESDNPKVKEYAQHLHAQSSRLKKLIEDLMEASKASTGNLEVHVAPCDVRVLLGQCLGEYEDKLKEKHLELILKQGEKPLRILADPRLLWRVFDNLMNNICKYAQKDTRVYLSSEKTENCARISFKNVSKYALDVSPQDLLERFVRGDLSRHTEGNGLGLSIVNSLMELQGGRIELAVEADLFKVTLEFPFAPADEAVPALGKDCAAEEKKV